MRKLTILALALFMSVIMRASEKITFQCSGFDDITVGHPIPKSPMQAPTVYIEDYTLSFAVGHPEYVLQITDEDGDVVYTTTIFSSLTDVILPSTLSGNYEIQLTMGNWLFTGYITL